MAETLDKRKAGGNIMRRLWAEAKWERGGRGEMGQLEK
jgi:hypothetical protein